MSDLRDCIATALGGELYVNLLGNGYDVDDLLALADAVIAELGLREEREDVASFQPGEIDDSMMPPRRKGRLTWTPSHRYVTEWISDE